MLKKRGGKNGGRSPGSHSPQPHCKIEAGVAEINNQLCSAMFGLVLSEQALKDFQSRRPSNITYPSDKKVNYVTLISLNSKYIPIQTV